MEHKFFPNDCETPYDKAGFLFWEFHPISIAIATAGIMTWVVVIKAYRLMSKITAKYPLTR